MEAKRYKKIRDNLNKDNKIKDYENLKTLFKNHAEKFNKTDNLFFLTECMIIGTKILELNSFPIKRFIKYKIKK